MAKTKRMSTSELSSLCDSQISDAVSYEESELSGLRDKALEYREGEMKDLPPEEGKSSVVSMDVNDTIAWIKPGLGRIFTSSDQVVAYQPQGPGDEDDAEQATDYVNHLFLRECKGYKLLMTVFDDALGLGNGIIKHWWDKSPCYEVESFSNLSDDAFTLLVSDDDVEVIEHTARNDPASTFAAASPSQSLVASVRDSRAGHAGQVGGDEGQSLPVVGGHGLGETAGVGGQAGGGQAEPDGAANGIGIANALAPAALLHDVKIKRTVKTGKLCLKALPPEELLIPRDATAIDEDISGIGHARQATRSQLIKEGFKREEVDELPAFVEAVDETSKSARDGLRSWQGTANPDKSMEKVKIYEWYPLVDFDGDGVAERRRVIIGDRTDNKSDRKILLNEEWGDPVPFVDIVPDPVAHRRRGRSQYDNTNDIQRIKTALWRAVMNNTYQVNEPMTEAVEGQVINPDALINKELGGVVWVKQPGMINAVVTQPIFDKVLPVMELADGIKQGRTGVGRQTMGLDPDALQNQTAEAVRDGRAASETQTEFYARNIAEDLQVLFGNILKLVVKNQDKPKMIRLRDEWVEMDPRPWNANMDCTINVGLGAGSRDRDMVMLQAIAGKQEQILLQLGPANPVVTLVEYRNTLAEMVQVGGLKVAEKYFREVTPEEVQQMAEAAANQPDPKMAEAQGRMQIEQMKAQGSQQLEQQKAQAGLQMEGERAQQTAQIEMMKHQGEMALRREQITAEMALKREQLQAELILKREQMAAELELKRQMGVMSAQVSVATSEVNMGGEPG